MRNVPDENEYEQDKKKYAAETWMMEQLERNWDYVGWGPYEDYMANNRGPNRAMTFASWSDFRTKFTPGHCPTSLTDRSGGEIVGWYFNIERDSTDCSACERTGCNPETRRISEDWYDFAGTGRRWCDNITQHEADALTAENRLWDLTHVRTKGQLMFLMADGFITMEEADALWEGRDKTLDRYDEDTGELVGVDIKWRDTVPADQVNAWNKGPGMGHDGINRWICVRARAEREGVYGLCPACDGDGYLPVDLDGRLQLILWVVNPATGQNYAIEVDRIQQKELDPVYDFLAGMRDRLVSRLDLPMSLSVEDLMEFANRHPTQWTHEDSMLSTTGGWASPSHFRSWREFCRPVHWKYGEGDDQRVPDDHPKFEELWTGAPAWGLDDLNELIGVDFEFGGRGPQVQRVHFWMAHPRKGCSRRVTIDNLRQKDLAGILTYVMEGRERARARLDPLPNTPGFDRYAFLNNLMMGDVPRDVVAVGKQILQLLDRTEKRRAEEERKRKARAKEG